jgi:hypothetical protein
MTKGSSLARGNVVTIERRAEGAAVRIDLGRVSRSSNQYSANWYEVVRSPQGSVEIRFGEFIPYTKSLATLLTVEIPSPVMQSPLVSDDRRFRATLRTYVEAHGGRVSKPASLDTAALAAHPPKTHLIQASIFALAFWEGGAEMTFFYLSPRTYQRVVAGGAQGADDLIESVVTVRLSSALLLALLDDLGIQDQPAAEAQNG